MIALVSILVFIVAFHFISKKEWKAIVLTVSSLLVYYFFVKWYVLLIPVLSLLTYCAILLKHKYYNKRLWTLIVYCTLIILGFTFLKYSVAGWALPVGYSVLAFSGISAVVDSKRHNSIHSFVDACCFLAFFPKLLAGPLERIDQFISQVDASKWDGKTAYIGLKYIVFGLFGKYVVADGLGLILTFTSFGLNIFLESVIYAIQFYIDFWSYCNLASGFSYLYGIQLTRNFSNPYSATTFKQFWRSWNISLSTWLRDYIYIPLGGNRTSSHVNVFCTTLVFLISALWHGSTTGFILWGAISSVLYCFEKFILPNCIKQNWTYRVFVILTIMLLWQLFRLPSFPNILTYIGHYTVCQPLELHIIATSIIAVVTLVIFESSWFQGIVTGYPSTNKGIILEVISITVMLLSTLLIDYNNSSPFFYFSY